MRNEQMPAYGVASTWRDIEAVDPSWDQPNEPNPPIPAEPITTRLEGPWGVPWIDGLEDPTATTGLARPSQEPSMPVVDTGWEMPPGDYRGEYRTRGPIQAFGHEVSGGLWGDQAIGRTMRFPINIPDRYDANGVWVGDYRDSLAAQLAANDSPAFSDYNSIDDLVTWTGPPAFAGWED